MQIVNLGGGTSPIEITEHVFEGVKFKIRRTWIGRSSSWWLDYLTIDGTTLIQGVVVRVGTKLLAPFADKRLPGEGDGEFVAIDTSGRGLDPARDDFGTRVVLTYSTAAEVAAAQPEEP
jgi:hypothetical protein